MLYRRIGLAAAALSLAGGAAMAQENGLLVAIYKSGTQQYFLDQAAGFTAAAEELGFEARTINAYIATGRAKHPADVKLKIGGPLTQGMRRKLKRAGWRSRYRLRKQIVEPVFGQIKQARGFRQFLLRGIDAVAAEWAMICIAHNLTKLARAT